MLPNLYQSNLKFDLLIPFQGFKSELIRELELKSVEIRLETPRAVLVTPLKSRPIWAQDWWPDCQLLNCEQSSENSNEKSTVDYLKSQPNFGVYHQIEVSKIADRIHKKIKTLAVRRIKYQPQHPFNFKFYTWSIIENFVIFCAEPSQRFPLGWHEFEEDKFSPPNRAYLKLWELFGIYKLNLENKPDVLEIGASPGGWSWVLSQHAKTVYTVDRAELDPKLHALKNINHKIGDAFKLNAHDYKSCTWLYSDLICTPEKMYDTVCYWQENSAIQNFVCTIKFKGECDFEILKKFENIPNSQIIHLYQNKHEVTWIKRNE